MAKSYFPSARKTKALFDELGFTEVRPDAPMGGYIFTRQHPDGRTQALYVFHWSNFTIAEQEGILPCRFSIRPALHASTDTDTLIADAVYGAHTFIAYTGAQRWDDVTTIFRREYMPLLDAPYENAQARLDSGQFGDNGEFTVEPRTQPL